MDLKQLLCLLVVLLPGTFAKRKQNFTREDANNTKKVNWKERIPKAVLSNLTETLLALESENDASQWVTVDLQGMRTKGVKEDLAPKPLLKINDEEVYKTKTIMRLKKLYDNYFPEVNKPEVVTEAENKEDWDFLNAVMATPIFQEAKNFLIMKDILTEENFEDTIHRIWFEQYPRAKNSLGSSGFEHVFLGEIKRGVSGFHNWLYFGDQEKKENLDYLGYLKHVKIGESKSWITHSFKWRDNLKPISSMFIGTTPEFEMSLITVCWFIRPNSRCWFTMNGTDFSIQTYIMNSNNMTYIGSGYADNAVLPGEAPISFKAESQSQESSIVAGASSLLGLVPSNWFIN
ncbi:unnamed protein product [Allacma fusca]|uniref:EndoU domain-containing protein n=1 Tax=Allacma fusca TaxID=39272 RepID=A0A8J2KGV9_9HEXA|nr:unnamed protein product [Allacma fusca]